MAPSIGQRFGNDEGVMINQHSMCIDKGVNKNERNPIRNIANCGVKTIEHLWIR